MRAEGLLYGLAFLGILGAGALLVGPRLREPSGPGREKPLVAPVPRRPVPATSGPRLHDAPPVAARVVTLTVVGPGGALRGPLKPPVGADARALSAPQPGHARLELTLTGEEVAFGAAGHQWVRRAAATLEDGTEIVLPAAAPSVLLRVREADGAPAAGVPVEVRPASPAGARRTDGGGTLVLDDLQPGLVVLLVGGREREAAALRVVAGAEREARVVLEPPLVVTGQVRGPGGSALEGARIEAFDARGPLGAAVTSGPGGAFTWVGPVQSVLALRVTAAGRASECFEIRPGLGALAVAAGELLLPQAEVEVSGRVRGAPGRPEARVTVEPAAAALLRELMGAESVLTPPWSVPLAADGSFVARGLPADVALRLSLRGAGLPEDALLAPRAGDRVVRDFEPVAGETLRAHITDGPGGAPVAGQLVLVSSDPVDGDAPRPADRLARTDAAGRLVLDGLTRGPWYLRAYRPGFRSLLARADVPTLGDVTLRFAPALSDASRRLQGRVVDDLGRPLAGVTLRAAGVSGVSAPDGRFVLDGVESLSSRVTLSCGYEPGAALVVGSDPRLVGALAHDEVTPGGAPLTLVLPGDQTLAFRALDGLDDRPIGWLHIVARADDGRILWDRALAAAEGRYVLPGLPRVGLTLTLLAPGRRLERLVVLERVGGAPSDARRPRDLGDLVLLRGLSLEGLVSGMDGAPLPGARAAALDKGWLGTAGDVVARRELALRVALADESGRFTLAGLDPQKPAAVVVWAPGRAPTLRRAVVAESGRAEAPAEAEHTPASRARDDRAFRGLESLTAKIDARLKPGSRLSLLLTDQQSAEPVHGAIIDLESARNGSDYLDLVVRGVIGGQVASSAEWRAVSEHLLWEGREEGAYTLGPVEPGEYELIVEHPLYLPERRRIPVLDAGAAFAYEALEPEDGARFDPNDPGSLARVRRGPEMVTVYGSDKMRIPISLRAK